MVPIDPEASAGILAGSDDLFGPTAILLVGFAAAEVAGVVFLLESLGATDHVRLVTATPATLAGSLKDALGGGGDGSEPPAPPTPPHPSPTTLPRAVFLSGFYSAEVVDLISAWREEAALPEPVWAAAVPNNWEGRTVWELVEAVAADDREVQARRRGVVGE